MQFKKEDIRQTIIDKAREEFLIKGFKDASLRTIAKDAGVGLSNIYNYFKNKDDLFCEVLAPTLTNSRLEKINESINNIDHEQ